MSQPKFVYSKGYRAKVPAKIVGPELLRLAGDRGLGGLTPKEIVNAAKAKRSPIHRVFEWNDSVAGEHYRLQQARLLIGNLRILVVYANREPLIHRVFVNLEDGIGYRSSVAVEQNASARARLIELVMGDLRQAQTRLAALQDFSGIVRELAVIEQRLRKAAMRVA